MTLNLRVFLWGLLMGPLDSGGVCSMGRHSVFGIDWVFQIKGPHLGPMVWTGDFKGSWSMHFIWIVAAYGMWPQFHASCGPSAKRAWRRLGQRVLEPNWI